MTVLALFTLIMGIVEFGRIYSIYQDLTDAAREGARYAVAPDQNTETLPSVSAVQAHVAPVLSSLNISNGTITVTPKTQTINGVVTTYSTVTVSAPYSFFFLPFAQITLTADSEMRNETN
jgi:Flp pilus assembly protein TadG